MPKDLTAPVPPVSDGDSAPDDTATEDNMVARLQVATTRLSRRLRRESGAALTPSQISVMASIHRHGEITLGALAECERVAPPTISRVVAKLEAGGLVARIPDPEDRRVARVRTTAAGEDLLSASRQRKAAWLADRLAQLTDDERARIGDALDALERLADQP